MLNIEYKENLDEEFYKIIDDEFNKFAEKNKVVCNYTPFSFIAKDDEKFVGIITGNSYYKEVHISDLIVISILEVNLCKLSKSILKKKVLKI